MATMISMIVFTDFTTSTTGRSSLLTRLVFRSTTHSFTAITHTPTMAVIRTIRTDTMDTVTTEVWTTAHLIVPAWRHYSVSLHAPVIITAVLTESSDRKRGERFARIAAITTCLFRIQCQSNCTMIISPLRAAKCCRRSRQRCRCCDRRKRCARYRN